MNSPIETMESQGCKVTIKCATDKEKAISLRTIEEMLMATLLHEPLTQPYQESAPIVEKQKQSEPIP